MYLDALGDPRDWPASDPAYMALFQKLPAPMRTPPPPSSDGESRSFTAYRARQMRNEKFAFPESELRNIYETNPDGTQGRFKNSPEHSRCDRRRTEEAGVLKIRQPVLALYEFPRSAGEAPQAGGYQPKDAEVRAAIDAYNTATAAYVERWKKNLQGGVPGARFVDLPGAGHFVFLTREAEVLQEVPKFVAGLR